MRNAARPETDNRPPRRRRVVAFLLPALGLPLLVCAVFAWRPGLFLGLPDAGAIDRGALAPSSLIVDRNGRLLYEIIDPQAGSHRPLALDEIPLTLRQAVIATEDASFYRNPGIDLGGILRAAWQNLRAGEIRSGASTITQQVARNLLMSSAERAERTWQRKLREAALAYHLTRSYSKDEILALYLNQTYLGNMAYGVEAAARAYFGKPVSQLDLAECAMLAGLPQSPSAYNPLTDPPAARARQRIVLGLMVEAGYITQADADLAAQETLHLAGTVFPIEAPHYSLWVRQQLGDLLGEERVRQGGLRVETTLDLDLQRAAEDAVRRQLTALNEPSGLLSAGATASVAGVQGGHNVRNAAVVALDPHTGELLALVGSPDYGDVRSDGAVNAALALRQPGSAIKPVTYAAAFARGYAPGTVFADVRTAFVTREGQPYVPENYDYQFHGLVRLRQALACSYNVTAVKLLDAIGIDSFVAMARQLGLGSINAPEEQGLAVTLGGNEVSLLELTAAYGAFANGGLRVQPVAIRRVLAADGEVLYDSRGADMATQRAIDARVAYLVTDVLADDMARVPAFGEGSALDLPWPAAVKTGTTTDWRDNWTVGYTDRVVVGVWVGNADGEPMREVTGLTGAAPIWNGVMRAAGRLGTVSSAAAMTGWQRPAGLVEVSVCPLSGLLPGPACASRVTELYLAEHAPVQTCDLHVLVSLDARDGSLAMADTPAAQRITRRLVRWPAEALPWAEEQGLIDATTLRWYAASDEQGDTAGSPRAGSAAAGNDDLTLSLLSPDVGSVYRLSREVPGEAQQLEVAVQCAPGRGAGELRLWVDGDVWHTWASAPSGVYRVLWPLQAGEHAFRVEADVSDGVLSSEMVRIRVEAW